MIEMVVVIAILGILVAIMVPTVRSAIRDSKTEQARGTIKTMADAYERIRIQQGEPGEIAFWDYVGYNPGNDYAVGKQQAENAADYLLAQGLVGKLPDTQYVVMQGGAPTLDTSALD